MDTSDGYLFFGTNKIKHATLADLVLYHVVRIIFNRGICCRDLIIVWFHLSMLSLPISIKVIELDVYFISIDWSYGIWIYYYLCPSVPITTKVVSSIQHYVLKFVSDLRQVDGFLRVLRFPPPMKLTAKI